MASNDAVAAVRSHFLARCKKDIAALEAAMADPGRAARETLKLTVHRLSGAAGVFGFREIGEMAAAMDDLLGEGDEIRPAEVQALVDAVRAIL